MRLLRPLCNTAKLINLAGGPMRTPAYELRMRLLCVVPERRRPFSRLRPRRFGFQCANLPNRLLI